MEKTEVNVLYKAAIGLQKFYGTKNAVILFVSLQIVALLIQVVLFSTGNLDINGIHIGSPKAWIVWFITTVSFLGSICMILTNILVTRESRLFIITNILGISLSIVNSIFSRSLMIVITMLITLMLVIHRFTIWNKEYKMKEKGEVPVHEKKVYSSKIYWIIIGIWLIYLLFSLVIIAEFGHAIYDPNDTGMRKAWTWWLDGVGSSTMILSMLLLTCKNKWGFVSQAIGTFAGVIIFLSLSQIVMCLSLLISCAMSTTAFLAWIGRDIMKERANQE